MRELYELTDNRSIEELEDLLWELLAQGYSIGGTICSHITDKINNLRENDKR